MKSLTCAIGAAAILLTTSTIAQIPPRALNSATTTPDFIKVVGRSDLFETQEGKLAAERGEDARVRSFGQEMVQAHTQTTERLEQAVQQAGLPAPPSPELGPDQKIMIDELKETKGADFDRLYLLQQAGAHNGALGVMRTYAALGDAPALRQAAVDTAPLVTRHLAEILMLQESSR